MNKNTTPTYKWQLVYGNPDKDHSYWVDRNSGRIAIKDESGELPHLTDDGVLWLDTHTPIVIDGSHATIPLLCAAPRDWETHDEGDKTFTGTSVVKALRVASKFHLLVRFKYAVAAEGIVTAKAGDSDLIVKFN